jgi:hypothetical protein
MSIWPMVVSGPGATGMRAAAVLAESSTAIVGRSTTALP